MIEINKPIETPSAKAAYKEFDTSFEWKDERLKVAYIMSRFPKLTETFILYEMLALEHQNVHIEVYPLLKARNTSTHPEGATVWAKLLDLVKKSQDALVMHPEAESFVGRAHYHPLISWKIISAQLYYLFRAPLKYLGALWTLMTKTWGSMNYFLGGLAIFPKTVYFARLMSLAGITHVHAHFANHPAAAALIIQRLTGIPYSFTAHGADLQVDQHMLCEKVKEADFVVTISNFNKEFIVEKCGEAAREKIHVVYCGVDTSAFRPAAHKDFPVQAGRPVNILCIGTMYEVKGHTYLIEACRLLQERGLNFVLHFIGDGPDRSALENQVRSAGLRDRVIFLGQRTRQEIIESLAWADIFALPSIPTTSGRREGIPVVLMEAMASGVPVVASGISGIPELVDHGKNGLLVPPRDPEKLAQALERLYENSSLRHTLAVAGREKVVRYFDLHTNAMILANNFSRGSE